MADIFHLIGSDLSILANGNFEIAYGAVEGQQRVLRRLLTNPADDAWTLDYGAGLAEFIGKTMSQARISARITAQMRKERAVSRNPPPSVDVSASTNNIVVANIHYVDTTTGSTSLLEFDTGV